MPRKQKNREREATPYDDGVNITFRITKDQKSALKEAARLDSRDITGLMRKLVVDFLEQDKFAAAGK